MFKETPKLKAELNDHSKFCDVLRASIVIFGIFAPNPTA